MSYDDGTIYDRRLVALFNKYGIKSTFNLNSGYFGRYINSKTACVTADEVSTLYAGHEVACHTVDHPTLSRCPMNMVVQEVFENRKALEKLVRYPVRGLALPNCAYKDEMMKVFPTLGIEYARSGSYTEGLNIGQNGFSIPDSFLPWHSNCFHLEDGGSKMMELGKQLVEHDHDHYFYMLYIWGHSEDLENMCGDKWDVMEQFCRMVSGREDIWYATNIEIVDYMKALNNLKFTAEGNIVYNPSAIPVWLTVDALNDNKIFRIDPGATVQLYELNEKEVLQDAWTGGPLKRNIQN